MRRPHLLRAQGATVERGVHLPRRPVSRGRLVHPLHGIHGRRDAVVARQLELLQELLRLGSPRAQAGGTRFGHGAGRAVTHAWRGAHTIAPPQFERASQSLLLLRYTTCLLYTSDAADEEDSVDLG